MARTILITSLAVLLAAPLLQAQQNAKQEEMLHKAHFLMSQEKFDEAADLLRKAIALAPDNRNLSAKAYLMLGQSLAVSGRSAEALKVLNTATKRYHDLEGFLDGARALADQIQQRERDRIHEAAIEKAHAAELEQIERDLKDRGLEGEELRRHYESAVQGFLAAAELKRITEMLKLAGLSEKEVEERLARIEMDRNDLLEERRREEERRALRERELAGDEHARREAAERAFDEAVRARERDWRADREQDARAAREEFLRLAERLGIGPEETERFLKEHAPRPEPGGHDPRVDELVRHVEELERKIGDALTSFAAAMEKRNRELEARLARIERALQEK